MSKIVILGGAGFVGSNLAETLVQSGHRVSIFDRPGAPRLMPDAVASEISWIEGSVDDTPAIRDAIRGHEYVCHLVSTTIPKTSNENPQHDIQSNLISTVNILDACRDAGTKKIIYLSSGGTVYGNTAEPLISESHPTRPISSYGIVKVAVENYLHLYNVLYGLQFVSLRLSNPYGRYQRPNAVQGAIAVFLDRAMKGETIEVWGDGEVVRDYIHISDVVDAISRAITYKGESGVFNLGAGAGHSLNEILEIIGLTLGKKPDVLYKEGRASDVRRNVLNIAKIKESFNWAPGVGLHEGIARTYRDKLQALSVS